MVAGLILAAGCSTRMGAQKLLLPLAGQPMIAHVVDVVLHSQVNPVIVVTGHAGAEIADALAGRPVTFAANLSPEREMLFSIRTGLRVIPEECEAVLVALGDQPGITAGVVRKLVLSFQEGTHGIVVPTCNGKRGHPMLLSLRYREEILRLYEGVGLRGLLDAHPNDILEVEVGTTGVLQDLDHPEDYRRASAEFGDALDS